MLGGMMQSIGVGGTVEAGEMNVSWLTFDNTNERLGIGTTSPQGNLGIGSTNGVGDETNPAFVIGPSAYRLGIWTDGETAIFNNKDGDDGFLFKVKTAGYALKIDGITGNIGIGTTSPTLSLHVNGGTTNEVALFESTDTAVEIQLKDSTGTSKIESRGDFRFSTKDVSNAVRIEADGGVVMSSLPTSDPSVAGELWNNSGVINISAG